MMGIQQQIGHPPMPAVAAILARYDRKHLGAFVAVAIDLMDVVDGDPDGESNGDDEAREADGDTLDLAWIEWDTMRGSQKRGPNIANSFCEDDEDSDPAEEDDDPGQNSEDEQSSGLYSYGWRPSGPGCPIADPDYGHDGS